jgi:TonB-dependent SusC/RagA subfamily outer membrane receptor
MKSKLLTIGALFVVLFFNPAYAQMRELTGQVTAEDGSSLTGVNISLKNTTKGATTDDKGRYVVSVEPGTTLVFSFIGFKSKEALVGNQTKLDITLASDETQLQEIVITSLGIAREKKALGYAVQEIKGDKLTLARDPNIGNALAGKIAGVQVLGQSAAKFGTPSIRIRGINSLAGSDPLYVVDGTPTDISMVNMDDVESLTVLKGPSATALYGNRASAGVVVVTTKRGKSGETSLTFNHSMTIDRVSLLPKYQNEYGGGKYTPPTGQHLKANECWITPRMRAGGPKLTDPCTGRHSPGNRGKSSARKRHLLHTRIMFARFLRNPSATIQTSHFQKQGTATLRGFRTPTLSTTALSPTAGSTAITSALKQRLPSPKN